MKLKNNNILYKVQKYFKFILLRLIITSSNKIIEILYLFIYKNYLFLYENKKYIILYYTKNKNLFPLSFR